MTCDDTPPATLNGQSAATVPAEHPAPPPASRGDEFIGRAPIGAAPEKRTAKGGAPALNANALRHGLDSRPDVVAMRLELGTLPDAMKRIEGDVYAFRRLVENAVMEAKGTIGLIDAALVQTACRHERASRLALAWLRQHEAELTHSERLAYSKAIADSSAARDKTLERLKIDHDAESDVAASYALLRAGALDAAPAADNAPGEAVGDDTADGGQAA